MSSSRYPSGYCRARIYQVDTSSLLPFLCITDPEYIRFPNDKRKKERKKKKIVCVPHPVCYTHVASAESKRDRSV